MTTRALRALAPALLLPTFMAHAGGWAVITVDDLPDYAVVGKPLTLSFMVRQHGVSPIDGLSARVDAKTGGATTAARARPGTRSGHYTATLTPARAGSTTLTIRSGFGKSDLTLLPMTVVTAGTEPTLAVSEVDRGKRLYVAKGCVTCHVGAEIGPNLEGRRFDATYLAGFLAKPRRISPSAPMEMPNLGLRQPEIASLVAFLNSDRQVSNR